MRYQIVRQHSEEDCGAACIATIAKHYGRNFAISRVREAVGTGSKGTTLLGLSRGADVLGFNYRQARTNPQQLLDNINDAPLPAIVHWKGYHWVVLHGKKGRKYVIGDPGVGIRYLSREELIAAWTNGIILLLIPDDARFYQQEEDKVGGLGRFLKRVWPYRSILAQAMAINIAIGLLSLAMPVMMQILTDDVLVRGDLQLLRVVAIGVIVLSLFRGAIGLVQGHLIGHFSQRLQLGLILDYGRQLLRLPLSYFEARRSGEVVSRIADVNVVNNLVGQIVLGLPSQFFIAVISLCFMLFYSWQLTIASIFAFIIVAFVNLLFLPAVRAKTRSLIVQGTENQGFLVETFRGTQVLKTTSATPQAWQEYQGKYGRIANLSWTTMKLDLYSNTLTTFLSSLTNVGLLWLGGYFVISDSNFSLGQLLAYNGMSGNFLGFLSTSIGLIDEFVASQFIIQRLNEVIEATPEEENAHKKAFAEIKGKIDITCYDLNYHHAGRVDLFKDFNVTIPGGKAVAIIGKSGCGKSTLAKLISGLYLPQSGNIRYGDYNQKDLTLESLRQQVVLIPQEAHFWTRSILDNFIFSYPDVTFEDVVAACKIVGADEFISELPDKYQTILGEFGANLSGGQKQRLAIARAIVSDPPILILDESTGALDPVSENQVLDRLLQQRQGKTTIFISHRPRVILRADWIVFLEKGKLQLAGTPQDLQAKLTGEDLDFLRP